MGGPCFWRKQRCYKLFPFKKLQKKHGGLPIHLKWKDWGKAYGQVNNENSPAWPSLQPDLTLLCCQLRFYKSHWERYKHKLISISCWRDSLTWVFILWHSVWTTYLWHTTMVFWPFYLDNFVKPTYSEWNMVVTMFGARVSMHWCVCASVWILWAITSTFTNGFQNNCSAW